VTRDGARAAATLLVVPGASPPVIDDRLLLEAWTSATGGQSIPESQLETLGPALQRALAPPPEPVRWHPMRSAWWILPFALVLGAEWWMRRRSGLR
jgi:hypothetical protein